MDIVDSLLRRAKNLLCHLFVINRKVITISTTYNPVSITNVFQCTNNLALKHMVDDSELLVFDVYDENTFIRANSI